MGEEAEDKVTVKTIHRNSQNKIMTREKICGLAAGELGGSIQRGKNRPNSEKTYNSCQTQAAKHRKQKRRPAGSRQEC